jgi:hypothetical protein
MSDFETIRISCSSSDQFSAAISSACQALPPEAQQRLREIIISYVVRYGAEGTYQRINDRTVSQIFAEYQPVELRPIASGEVEGMRYALYHPEQSPATDVERLDDEQSPAG